MSKIRVLINPNAGTNNPLDAVVQSVNRHWDTLENEVTFQTSNDASDGCRKAEHAVRDGVDTLLVAGGDGMINTVGHALLDTGVALGVIPTGSGNGFARHFNIPLALDEAVRALAGARRARIDVGTVNDRPFFVTCSMAWEAAIARSFERLSLRGPLPYLLAGFREYVTFTPQPLEVTLDGGERLRFPDPMIFTVANLTQYGGGAKIAPHAEADDGQLELIVLPRQDVAQVITSLPRLYDGTLLQLPDLFTRRFRDLTIRRAHAAQIQLDGELLDAGTTVNVSVLPQALTVLVPATE
ncbi:MAG: diacylglycerol kinase family lipid kinase [Kiritimatiellaeota bacterium]|nr:diacylglycerol kinase family lipid kinase [Kiritimatiellota bacterium]